MSALKNLLANVGDENKARVENVDGKRVLYVSMSACRQHFNAVLNLVHYHTEVDYAIVVSHGQLKVELRPTTHKE